MKGVMGNILKKHLDQALQGEKVVQGLGFFFERQKSQHLSNVKLLQPRADLFKLGCHVLCGGERQQVPGKGSIQANADTDVGQLSNVSIDVVHRVPGQEFLQIYVSTNLIALGEQDGLFWSCCGSIL